VGVARYSVGFDLGDGESAIAWIDNYDKRQARLFERASGEVSVLTAIAESVHGTKYFGEAALLQPESKQIQVNFKERPVRSLTGIVPTIPAVEFAKLFLIEFLERYQEIAEDCRIYVGYPAGWNADKEVDVYRQQLSDALRPYQLTMVAESQSAFIDVHDAAGVDATRRPALVIDVGSSTTDFTLVTDTIENLPFGSDLGCRLIDQAVADELIASLARRDRDRFARATTRNLLLWICRRYKEASYLGVAASPPAARHGEVGWVVDTCWERLLAVDVQDFVNRRWRPRFREELYKVLGRLQGVAPELVLTTGGGSRMSMVAEECCDVFGPDAIVPVEGPSLAVARGLASYGRWADRVSRFHEEIRALPERIGLNGIVAAKSQSLAQQFYQSFYLVGWHGVVRWAQADPQLAGAAWTYPRLMEWYFAWLESPEGKMERDKIIGPLEHEVGERLYPEVERLCSAFGLPADAISTHIHLPAGVIIRPMGRLMKAFDLIASAHGIVSQLQAQTRLGKAYLANVAPGLARAFGPAGMVLARGYYFTRADLGALSRGIREEIQAQLAERVREVESLLV
jgi:hypothetical protein